MKWIKNVINKLLYQLSFCVNTVIDDMLSDNSLICVFHARCVFVPCNNSVDFFSCSNAKQMPASVRDALKEVFQQEGSISPGDAEQMLEAMERSGQMQSETWSWSHDPESLQVLIMTDSTRGICLYQSGFTHLCTQGYFIYIYPFYMYIFNIYILDPHFWHVWHNDLSPKVHSLVSRADYAVSHWLYWAFLVLRSPHKRPLC